MTGPNGPRCPHCEALNPSGQAFCGSCGLALGVAPAPSPSRPPPPGPLFDLLRARNIYAVVLMAVVVFVAVTAAGWWSQSSGSPAVAPTSPPAASTAVPTATPAPSPTPALVTGGIAVPATIDATGATDASAALINYGFTFYETVDVKKAHDTVLQPHVYKGAEQSVPVGPATDLRLTVPRGQSAMIATAATLREPLIAPLTTDVAVGELQVTLNGTVISRTPLYPLKPVAEAGWWGRMVDSVSLWFK